MVLGHKADFPTSVQLSSIFSEWPFPDLQLYRMRHTEDKGPAFSFPFGWDNISSWSRKMDLHSSPLTFFTYLLAGLPSHPLLTDSNFASIPKDAFKAHFKGYFHVIAFADLNSILFWHLLQNLIFWMPVDSQLILAYFVQLRWGPLNFPDIADMIRMWNGPHPSCFEHLMTSFWVYFGAWETCRRWRLVEGSKSLSMGFEVFSAWPHFLFFFCFQTAEWCSQLASFFCHCAFPIMMDCVSWKSKPT